jgi:hypothetical protein
MIRTHAAVCLVLCGFAAAAPAAAGQRAPSAPPAAPAPTGDLPFAFDGPASPQPPDVISRDATGRATVRAERLTSALRVDGRLDEEVYTTVPPITGLIQVEPQEGAPGTERTDAWVLFDDDRIYISFRCWESRPDRIIANEMRRDNFGLYQNDYVSVVLDTFYDRRNAVYFTVTPLGGRGDAQITNERQYMTDWNTVWDVEVGRFEGGWTAEFAIPFKSLRYRPGRAQIWGFNIERRNRWKNEFAFLTRIPAAFGFNRAFMQISYSATLVGLEVPPGSKNLEVKPFATSHLTTDLTAASPISNDPGGGVGLDVKYGVTQNVTADFTLNTDFAQVEADEQRVNLTRFSLFFPEKREFFLENQGMFGFGGSVTSGNQANASDTPILFYSRRIGLNRNRVVPIAAGGRLTGRLRRFNLGALNIETNDERVSASPATNFTVLRLKRDVLRRSSVGVMYTGRSIAVSGAGRNDTYGVDGAFTFFDNLAFNAYWARTHTEGRPGDDVSYRAQMDYAGDRYGVQIERLAIGADFNPEVGFVRRGDMRRSFGLVRYSPRPRSSRLVRKYFFIGSLAYIENGRGMLETRDAEAEFDVDFHNSDRLVVQRSETYEFLPAPFRIAPAVVIPIGGYRFGNTRAAYSFGQHRMISGNVSAEHGTFYSGDRTAIGVSSGRVKVRAQLSIEPTFSINWVDLAEGAFTTRLVGSRVTYTMTPRMFASALVQYNSSTNTVAANVRLRWEYQPGSELFVVYNEERDTMAPRFPQLANRAFIVKVNRLFRF